MSESGWTLYQVYHVRNIDNLGTTNDRVVRNSDLADDASNVCKPHGSVVVVPRFRALAIVRVALRKIAVTLRGQKPSLGRTFNGLFDVQP
jgi:hypothetical protein